jgi:hypothetical protein
MTFESTTELHVTLNRRSVREVEQELADLGDVEIGVSGSTMSAQATRSSGARGMGSRERRWRRREHRWARDRTELTDDAVAYLEDIEDHVAEGGAGGGIFGQISNTLLDTSGEAAGAGALTGAAGALSGAAGALTGAAAALSGASIIDGLSGNSIQVERPEWAPIGVKEPPAVEFEDPPKVGYEEPPTLQIEEADPLPVEQEPLAVEREPLSVAYPSHIPVSAPAYIPVRFPEMRGGGGQRQSDEEFDRSFADDVVQTAGFGVTTGAGAGFAVGAFGGGIGAIPGAAIGAVGGGALGAAGGALGHIGARAHHELEQSGTLGGGGYRPADVERVPEPRTVVHGGRPTTQTTRPREQTNRIHIGSINVDAEVQQEDLDREMENLREDILDEVDDRIEKALNDLEREITRGRR